MIRICRILQVGFFFFFNFFFFTDVASIKGSSKSLQSEHLRKRCVQGEWWKGFEVGFVEIKGMNADFIFFFFFLQAVCIILRKNKRGQLICGSEKDNSQCSMFKLPPHWAAHEPVDMVVWCWMENKNPPQQTERAGTERLEQRKRG